MRSCGDKFNSDKSEWSTLHPEMPKHRHWVSRGRFQEKCNRERETDRQTKELKVCAKEWLILEVLESYMKKEDWEYMRE